MKAGCNAYPAESLPVLPTISRNAATASALVTTFQPAEVALGSFTGRSSVAEGERPVDLTMPQTLRREPPRM